MNVVLVIASLGVGGTEQKVIRLANYFAAQGKDVEVLSLSLNNSQKEKLNSEVKLTIIDTNSNIKARLSAKKCVFNYLKKQQASAGIIPAIFYFNYYPALFVSSKLIKQVVFINTTHLLGFMSKVKQKMAIKKMKFANAIVMGNSELAEEFKRFNQLKNTRIEVLQNGIDTNYPVKECYQVNDVFRLVVVARLRPEKRHADIFKAVKILLDKSFKIELDCIGSQVLDGQEEQLKHVVEDLSLQKHVNFLGEKNNVRQLLPNYDAFVLPSNDTFSNALLEAMAAGLPVLGANVGGSPEIISDSNDGLLYDFMNQTDLADKIEGLILNEQRRKNLGLSAINKINKNFSSDCMYKKYEAYINE
ncbi:glycosyltransferase family 4 protein [Pseudoalteromonas sp. SCSIO 43095]|uniref:glycosyltransferase family 4 protein n=1 Tax=Pseudoalteromonas sp. SCSIO 43095 TaxID=2894202 RepID=UPI00202B4D5C|nr:glycosyltransferase family 4 protein [Pseudoalteromonas sp. SCSIO 43095]URQ97583.1 glycosyltransferase family 4 protein [Pseudoalteromonas sp. SCSIO 43095]